MNSFYSLPPGRRFRTKAFDKLDLDHEKFLFPSNGTAFLNDLDKVKLGDYKNVESFYSLQTGRRF